MLAWSFTQVLKLSISSSNSLQNLARNPHFAQQDAQQENESNDRLVLEGDRRFRNLPQTK